MPTPVASWAADTFPTAKSLNTALYSSDGTGDNPTGVSFLAARPILYEAYTRALSLTTSTGGVQSTLSSSGSTTTAFIILDSAGYYGMTQDQPGAGYYQFLAAVKGSSGDGVNPGGWTLLSHFAAVAAGATQTAISADLLGTAMTAVSGSRQAPSTTLATCAFFLDLVDAGTATTWSPAVTVRDSGSAGTALIAHTADPSGQTCRLAAIWAAVSATTAGTAVFTGAGTYPWTAPAGVTSPTVSLTGGGAGGGAGNSSGGGIEYGGGGGGGAEYASGTIATTPGSNYSAVAGAGGAGGTAPGAGGSAGGASSMAGNSGSVTAHGGSGGAGATTIADGAGGAGGTGSGASTHHDGGAGAAGTTAVYGGGGGSSAGPAAAGTTATSGTGAPAPAGAGPGGAGGQSAITVVQRAAGSVNGSNTLTVALPSPAQPGNSILVLAYYQGRNPSAEISATLNASGVINGTPLTPQVQADLTSLNIPLQTGLLDIYNITGGEESVTITGHGTDNTIKVLIADVLEVAGLGPSPSVEVSDSHTQGGGHPDQFYDASAVTAKSPELWVGFTGAQYTSAFAVNDPDHSQGWSLPTKQYRDHGGYFAAARAVYQTVTATGTMAYSGTFSTGVSKGTLVAAYVTSAVTAGNPPITGPGGGGGGGLGAANGGGQGADGQVILTWVSPSGSGYGNPASPVPYSAWTPATTISTGTGGGVDINGPAGITDVLNFLQNPPAFRIGATTGQSIPSATVTAVTFSGTTPGLDSYTGWSSGTYTIPRDGLYLFHGLACFAANSSNLRRAGATINGTTYWGPVGNATAAGTCNVGKTQIFSLKAGDTVQLSVRQGTAGALALDTGATNQTRFLLLWLGTEGTPPSQWSPPDTTFRWASGTQGENLGGGLAGLMQQHLASDLGFLSAPPYLMAHQAIAQSGLANNAFSTVTLDTVGGLIHGSDVGDSYSGWTSGASNSYTAQVPGWYLMVGEFFTTPAAATTATVTAGILPTTSGGATPIAAPDYYQALSATTSANAGGGATVFGLQYMLTGESITPQVMGAGMGGTYGTLEGTQNGGQFNSHLEVVWISE